MAEAEDVLVDAARHGTVFIRDLWQRHRGQELDHRLTLADLAPRLDLLLSAVYGTHFALRVALAPAHPTLLDRLFRRHRFPRQHAPIPATDGASIWLPDVPGIADRDAAGGLLRAMALHQARRALRGGARQVMALHDPLLRDLVLLYEARGTEADIARELPGMIPALTQLRQLALQGRPPVSAFTSERRPLERLLREMIAEPVQGNRNTCASLPASLAAARTQLAAWQLPPAARHRLGPTPLLRDWWTGEFRADGKPVLEQTADAQSDDDAPPVRSARMPRRPEQRDADDDEDGTGESGAWMVQQDHPHEIAEDPFGLQRPVDRDEQTSAEEFGDMLSELSAARVITSPERAREVLLSDDPPASRMLLAFGERAREGECVCYPEWDYTRETYRERGVTVRLLAPQAGPPAWVDAVLARHRSLLAGIRRQFEMLRSRRVRLRRQSDGDDIDLDARVHSHADLRAGGAHNDTLYEARRPGQRSIAILLLIDVSGSTDAWIGGQRRVIDVEREALLLVCIALQELAEPYAVQAFSGEGPHGVTVRTLKEFDEHYGRDVALRIAALEPERYTRTGAALRHATARLMTQDAQHRLLLLLSDGKPNDADRYDGRYGVEDTRQAVNEARLQGVFPFCLTIDRQAPSYMPQVFGANSYALLQSPQRLPLVLLDWMRRLIAH